MTPIFPVAPDDAPVPASGTRGWRVVAVGAMVGAAVGAAGVVVGSRVLRPAMPQVPDMALPLWTLLPLLMLVLFVAILTHELGHVAGGVIAGWRFQLLVVGPFRIERELDSDAVRWRLNRDVELAGGVAACEPVGSGDLVRQLQWLVVGGPLASFLLAAVGGLAAAVVPRGPWFVASISLCAVSLLIGLITMIPMQNGSFVSDGRRFLRLRRGDVHAKRDAAQLAIMARDRAGVPITEQPIEWLHAALEPVDGSVAEMIARWTVYSWLLLQDAAGEAEAEVQLGRAEALSHGLPFNLGAAVAVERGFVAAYLHRDASSARARAAQHAKGLALLRPIDRARFEAAVAYADGNPGRARERIHDARNLLNTSARRLSGGAQWTSEVLDRLERKVDALSSLP
jgi:hypothetical protein